ncbi:MAG: hypothetical protein GWN93_05990 [Deltaproteobacteria bacterium]|nr:hypothetical protein [Deltaproteobacteria bacterium]
MSDNGGEKATIKYGGKTYALTAEGKAFIDAVMASGLDQDAAFAAYQAAAGSGAIKVTHKPKEVVPDLAELAGPTVAKAMKRNKTLQTAVQGYFDSCDALDALTAEAGLGDGFLWGGETQSFVRLTRDVGTDGIKSVDVRLDKESDIAGVARSILDAHRSASQNVMAIVGRVAKKEEIDPMPTIRVELVDRETVTISQKKAKRRSGGGGGGDRASYKTEVADDGKVTITMTMGEKEFGPVSGSTRKELTEAIKGLMKETGKEFYLSQWSRKEWWPES